MDTIVHAAIEEICSKGVNGVSLSDLFDRLQPSLSTAALQPCAAVKRAVFSGLVGVKGIQFFDGGSGFDPKSKSFEECEVLDLRLVADEQLRGCFVGLYDVKASNITNPQQKVLELLAEARGNGITQDELCRRLHIPANNFFYVVKRLESWGLVVRQSTIKRTKEAPVRTNLIRLHRYAVPLGSQQRLEITNDSKNSEDNFVDNVAGGYCMSEQQGQDDVLVKDFLPALKAVCDRLEQSEGKVLVVSDIKRELGYREVAGHRAWRNICKRLTQAGLIEVFEAKVDQNEATTPNSRRSKSRGQNKAVQCLRLLKTFSLRLLEKRTPDCEHENLDSEQPITRGNHIQNTEQLVELPLDQQIYDMIDREGSKGLLGVEVCRRLGITTKMFDNLNNNVIRRFGLHQLSENRKRGSAYRFWTRDSFNVQLPNSLLSISEGGPDEHALGLSPVGEPSSWENLQRNSTGMGSLALERCTEQQLKDCPQEDRGSCEMVVWSKDSEDLIPDKKSITLPVSDIAPETNSNLVVYSSSPVLKPLLQQGQRYPSVTSTQREQRIIERLKTERIILKPELQRWLESFEKDNQTRMDRKTLSRLLRNLKKEGHCKTMVFNVPDVTNYSHLRDILVILHPSVDCSHGELSNQVVDRQRSFEMQIRGAAAQSKKEVHVPVLHGIQRIGNKPNSDAPSVKSELMRANGFVLAKMVRTKLVHQFLWRYVNKLGDCNEALNKNVQSRNLHSSCLLFDLEVALKGMPLELFLQVVGSVLNMNDMTEKCKAGLLLSDLPQEEYKSLMDTRATGRLSWLIDILRRLRLIQLVADDSIKDAAESSHARLIYALELKPYIEEPPSVDLLLHRGSDGLDLRPHYRHDFMLSTSKAVHKYWQTLEYCYAAADAKAALHAFPGSVVNEVCYYKSWTTVRVMTAEQRSELFKRVKDQPNKKLTFHECRAIAKDLKLSLEQVLRVYYDHRQKRLSRVQGDLDVQGVDLEARSSGHRQSRRKRKTSPPSRRTKRANTSHTNVEEPSEDGVTENMEEPGVAEQEEHHESVPDGRGAIPMLIQSRQPKFSWTEDADRLLIIQYARQRAIQGARRGTDWASISELPAPTSTCRRRIAILNTDMKFRESLIRLCDFLSKRYARLHYEGNLMNKGESAGEPDPHGSQWDDFSESEVKIALHEVLIHKMQKVDTSKRIGSEGSQNRISSTRGFEKGSDQQQIESGRRARPKCLSQKFVKHLKEGYSIARRSTQSLAVASAVELFKLAFLTTSKSTEMPNLLAETIGRYSDHDRYSAFDYLREKKIMVGCGPSQPFVLSQTFLRCLSASQFPANTGKRASKSANWLHKKGKELMEGKVNLPEDLQCGDIFFLFSLVSSGDLSVSPLLPDESVGEAEDSRSTKRKYDDHELEDYGSMIKKSKYDDRRDKGFPGIKVSVNRATISRPNIVEFLNHGDKTLLFSENDRFYNALSEKEGCTSSTIDYVKESPDFGSIIPATVIYGDSKWEVMASYTMQYLLQHTGQAYAEIHPDLIENSHKAIQNAGDEGLSISKFSYYTGIKDAILAECIIDVLQLFGHVLKVNGYNSIHIVEGGYRTKYFLTSKATRCQDPESERSVIPQTVNGETIVVQQIEDAGHVTNCMNVDEVHKVTVLNLSEDVTQHPNPEVHNEVEGCSQSVRMSSGGSKETQNFDVSAAYEQPILPWVNGDGTINGIVYRGLTRRILGIVIQHPGILEGEIIRQLESINSQIQLEVLNPQSCRRFLSLMVLDKHLIVRKMTQGTSSGPPALLVNLIGKHSKKATFISRKHYFANPTSASLL